MSADWFSAFSATLLFVWKDDRKLVAIDNGSAQQVIETEFDERVVGIVLESIKERSPFYVEVDIDQSEFWIETTGDYRIICSANAHGPMLEVLGPPGGVAVYARVRSAEFVDSYIVVASFGATKTPEELEEMERDFIERRRGVR